MLFGEISENSITSLNLIVNQIYKPLVDRLAPDDWGKCEEEQKKEFTQVFEKFALELRDALKSLSGMIELRKYNREYDNDLRSIQS